MALAVGLPATAQEEAPSAVSSLEPKAPLANFNGAYRETIKIDVPAFRGLEPDLTLSYSSARTGLYPGQPASGWLGVGWTLTGVDVIERAVRGRGSPAFDDQDIFLLDGEEMIACGTGVISPSCSSGGTHATRVESYRRISREALGNTWEVTDRDGTRHTYRPVGEGQTFDGSNPDQVKLAWEYRWLLRSSIDAHGNVVSYEWTCGALPDCWLERISYNGTEVRFYWGDRSDSMTYATGVSLGHQGRRLKTIDVTTAGARVRAYSLAYDISPATARSRLTAVQPFGRDALLGADGAVTGGTSLPTVVMTYSGQSIQFSAGTVVGWMETRNEGYVGYGGNSVKILDLNNNRSNDILHMEYLNDDCAHKAYNTQVDINIGKYWTLSGCDNEYEIIDLNNDGRDDFIAFTYYYDGSDYHAYLTPLIANSNLDGSGSFGQLQSTGNLGKLSIFVTLVGDFDGDGIGEFGFIDGSYSQFYYVLNGAVIPRPNSWKLQLSSSSIPFLKAFSGDVNGDGRSDVITVKLINHNETDISIHLSYAGGFRAPITKRHRTLRLRSVSPEFLVESWIIADANGDGRTDLVRVAPMAGDSHGRVDWSATSVTAHVYLSMGNSFHAESWGEIPIKQVGGQGFHVISGDYNGDGRVDLLVGDFHKDGRRPIRSLISTGSAFSRVADLPSTAARGWTGDFNGDGRSDLLVPGKAYYAVDPYPDLLTSIRGVHGGRTLLSYTPSSRWSNQRLPFVVQTSTSVRKEDGRDQEAETKFAYAGGLWNAMERQFLGFKSSHVTLPCIQGEAVCPSVDITFSQNLASLGRAEKVEYKDGAGNLLRSIVHKYEVNNTTAPFTALNTGSTVTDYARMLPGDGGGNPDPDPTPVITTSFQGETESDPDYNRGEAKTINLGTPAPDRMIVVAATYRDTSLFGSLYLGTPPLRGQPPTGIPLTKRNAVSNLGPDRNRQLEIWTARVPEGTSNTIYFSGTQEDVADFYVSVFAVYGAGSEVPVSTAQAWGTSGTTISSSIDYPMHGLVLGFGRSLSSPNTWSGLEQIDSGQLTAASKVATYPGTAPLTVTGAEGDLKALLAVSFAPAPGP